MRTWTIFLGVSISILYCIQFYSLIEYRKSSESGIDHLASEVDSTSEQLKDDTIVSKLDESELKTIFSNVIDKMMLQSIVYSLLGLLGVLMLILRSKRLLYISAAFLSPLFVFKSIEYLENFQTSWKTVLLLLEYEPFLAIRNDILPMFLAVLVFATIIFDVVKTSIRESSDRI